MLRNRMHFPRLAAIALAAASLSQPSLALDYTWNVGSGDWNNAANWSLLGVPGSNDSATLATGNARLTAPVSVGTLRLTGGQVYGTGPLTVGTLQFTRGLLGGNSLTGYDTGSTTVTGSAIFDGTQSQAVGRTHTLTLQGGTTWTAGNGVIGGSVFGGDLVNATSGVVTDLGAASASGVKQLRDGTGGSFVNQGTYVRSGLGTTRGLAFNSTGTLQVQTGTFEVNYTGSLTGVTQVAAGATLAINGSGASNIIPITVGGSIDNRGLVRFIGGYATVPLGAVLGGVVEVAGGSVRNLATTTLQRLVMTSGQVYGSGPLAVGTLDFTRGTLGGDSLTGYDTGSTTVTGTATFDGTQSQAVGRTHTLTLQGGTTWTAGNGVIGGSVFGGDLVNAPSGVFTDQGTANASGVKQLRDGTGGSFVNQGSYLRSGLGTTQASGFSNAGLLQLDAGRLTVDGSFSNTGTVRLAAGATLEARSTTFANAGLVQGTGTVKTLSANDALSNAGTLDPGSAQATGALTVDGDLRFTDSAILRIDLANGELSDRLAITSDVLLNGELAIWAMPDLMLQGGEVFTIATYGQRLSASTFDTISWHGLNSQQFTVTYGANDITLRVSAVPEPATWAFFAAGLLAVGTQVRLRQQALRKNGSFPGRMVA